MFKLPSYWYQQIQVTSFVVVPGFEPRQVSLFGSSVVFLLVSISISLSLLASLALITLSSSSSLLSFCHSLSLCLLSAHPLISLPPSLLVSSWPCRLREGCFSSPPPFSQPFLPEHPSVIAPLTDQGPDMPGAPGWGPGGSSTEVTMETPPCVGEEALSHRGARLSPPCSLCSQWTLSFLLDTAMHTGASGRAAVSPTGPGWHMILAVGISSCSGSHSDPAALTVVCS